MNNMNIDVEGKSEEEIFLTGKYEGKKFYSTVAIFITGFFGGVLGAGYMLGQNFKVLGDDKNKINSYIGAVAAFFIICLLAIYSDYIPVIKSSHYMMPVIGAAIFSALCRKYQEPLINKSYSYGACRQSAGKIILVLFISLIITLLGFLAMSLILILSGLVNI